MTEVVDYLVENEIALIIMQNPPVNTLSVEVRNLIYSYFQRAQDDPEIRAIVILPAIRHFSAGADISEFKTPDSLTQAKLPELCTILDSSPKLLVAAISGVALGGGLELALGADYRIATEDARLGLPETTLGVIPGAGGTQRLTRLVSPQLAAEMMMTGKPISAEQAFQAGLVDKLHEGDDSLQSATVTYTRELLSSSAPLRDGANTHIDKTELPDNFYQDLRERYINGRKGTHALENCVLAIEAAYTLPFHEGLARETELFRERLHSAEARAIQHLFFAERNATKIPGLDPQTKTRNVKKAGVIGAGLMGGGIAMNFIKNGIPVAIIDSNEENVKRGLASIEKIYQSSVKKGRMTQEQLESNMGLLTGSTDYVDLSDADIVIEAVFEDMEVKKQVFKKLDEECKPGVILATNTSTLDVNIIAESTSRPEDVIGLHFFSPAHVMRLLEIVRADQTADDVLLTGLKLARSIGKIPVVVGVCYGFVGNRMMTPYFREAYRMLLEGAHPEAIDTALMDFDMAMGIISVIDMAGIDIICKSAEANSEYWQSDQSYLALLFKLRDLGFLGQKSAQGVYKYEGREKSVNPILTELIGTSASEHNVEQRENSHQEIVERCLYTMINEGAYILEEGIASRSSDIDLIYVNGYGFPAWKGGPMQYADEIGLDVVLAGINKYRSELGDYGKLWFKPSSLLQTLASEGKKFKDYKH